MSRVFADDGVRLVVITGTLPAEADWPALDTTELAATGVKNISDYAVVGSTDFVQAPSETNDERAYSDKGNVKTPTLKNANGKLTLYRDRDPDTGIPTANDPLQYFDDRQVILLIKRKGVDVGAAWATGQEYEIGKFQADHIATIGDADGSYEKIEVGLLFKGYHSFGTVTAP